MTGSLLSGVPIQKGAIIHSGISMDQVLANHIGQDTLQPSMVLACEQPMTGLSRDELFQRLQLAHFLAKLRFARAERNVSVARVRQPV